MMEKAEMFKGRSDSNHKWVRSKSGDECLCPMSAMRSDGSFDMSKCVCEPAASMNPRGG